MAVCKWSGRYLCARVVAHGYEAIMRYMSMAATGTLGSVVFRRVSLEQ